MIRSLSRIILSSTLVLGASTLSVTRANAQTTDIGFKPYGTTCELFGTTATLAGETTDKPAIVDLKLTAPDACCGTVLGGQFLMFGLIEMPGAPVSIPGMAAGCELHVLPTTVLALAPGSNTLNLTIPSIPGGLSFFVQGLNVYVTPKTSTFDLQLSNGLAMRTIV